MLLSHLVELDELVLTVRELNSREYIAEAIAAYRSRAYRSAIMGTWVAVAYDIISKIRELSIQGDSTAISFVTRLDSAILQQMTNYVQSVRKLQDIESGLLDEALNTFEFITPNDYSDMVRLKQDRNLCAHPAFATVTSLFQPSPELVRTHIVHAIQHLLQHPPTQGKNALARLKSDLMQPSFPADQKSTNAFMELRYLNNAKLLFLESLVTVFLKILIKQSESDLVGKEESILRCVVAFAIRHPDIFKTKMSEQLPRLTSGSDDKELNRVFALFKADKRCWTWLEQPTRIKMVEIVRQYTFDSSSFEHLISALEIDDLRPILLARIATFSNNTKEMIFTAYKRREFVEQAIDLLSNANRFRDSDRIGQFVVTPLMSLLSSEHVERILQAVLDNLQIQEASRTPEFLLELFKSTTDLHEKNKSHWQSLITGLMKDREPDSYYACPALRIAMQNANMFPIA